MTSNTSPKSSPPKVPNLISSPRSTTLKSPKQIPSKIPNLNPIKSKLKPQNNTNTNNTNTKTQPPPPELAPLKSPSPSPSNRFKDISLPPGWLDCPLQFIEPLPDHRILVCKTPIDIELSKHLKIPKDKYFLPHTIYTLPFETKKDYSIGLVIDLTNQKYYDSISFNNGKKPSKMSCKRRIINMKNQSLPNEHETSGFIGLVRSFLNSTLNSNKWIVIHDFLGYNISGYYCCAFMVKELNYSVDAALYQFANKHQPGIYNLQLIRLLYNMYADKQDLNDWENIIKIKPIQKPIWLKKQKQKHNSFIMPTTSIARKKRSFSEMNNSNNKTESLLSEPELINNNNNNKMNNSNIIMEPTLLNSEMEPIKKKQKINQSNKWDMAIELKQQHSYLTAVNNNYSNFISIIFQLSKTKELFYSIANKFITIPESSLMNICSNYRISWLGNGYKFWLMILGKKGCFFVDPMYFKNGKLGGIYFINGTIFSNESFNGQDKYLDGTLCCGELVIDKIKNIQKKVPRFLITDMLVFEKQSLAKFTHVQRLNKAENYLYKPFIKSLKNSKLRIRVKPMYNIENSTNNIIQKLKKMIKHELPHKCNGLGLFPIKPPFGQRILRISL